MTGGISSRLLHAYAQHMLRWEGMAKASISTDLKKIEVRETSQKGTRRQGRLGRIEKREGRGEKRERRERERRHSSNYHNMFRIFSVFDK